MPAPCGRPDRTRDRIGLLLPVPLGILPVFTPLAAVGLLITMITATRVHRRRGEFREALLPSTLAVISAVVAVGWGLRLALC
ncbi:DoxX family protein [Agromyces bauzanensis]